MAKLHVADVDEDDGGPLVDPDEDLTNPMYRAMSKKRRDRVYLAVSNHVNETAKGWIREVVERHLKRLADHPDTPEVAAQQTLAERPLLSKEVGRLMLAAITEIIFSTALRDGYFRFPDGYGSFRVQRLEEVARTKRLPTGEIVDLPSNRVRFRYEDGASIREALNLSKRTGYIRRFERESRLSNLTKKKLLGEGEKTDD